MNKPVSKPILSATVLLLRGDTPLEVLMVKRHYQIDFAAGALVFPGGKSSDDDTQSEWDAFTDGDFGPVQQEARIAAIREAFEESGVLLARHKSNRGVNGAIIGADFAEALAPMRQAVDRREQSFLELIREHELVLALDQLIYFGHWITPPIMPKRFDTHFYLAKAPSDQLASHDGRETTDAVWIDPSEALKQAETGEATIIFPTRMNLGKLARASSADAALKKFGSTPVVTVLPEIGKDDQGRPCLHIPAEADYDQTIELLENIKA